MIATARAIAPVDSQPTAQSSRGNVKRPMTLGCIVMIIMTIINGRAAAPLMTVLLEWASA